MIALLRHPMLVIAGPVTLGVAAVLFFLAFGSYTAESSFTPEDSGLNLASVAGLAAQFGVSVPRGVGGQSQSLDFYVDLLKSPALLSELARGAYRFPAGAESADSIGGDLLTLYGIKGDTPDERLRNVVKKLQGRIAVNSNRLANVVTIRVKAPWPDLAQQVNRTLLELVNQFNLERRQSQATLERRFVEERLALARGDLTTAEDSLQRFLEQNRTYQSSPRLTFDAGRLQRRIELQQQVYATLSQAYEQSRIQEVRNTPVITIIQRPEMYAARSRNPLKMGVAALVVGLFLGCTAALFLEYWAQEIRERPEGFRELQKALRRWRPWGPRANAA